ncbi:AcvB/VirJ family lysyl-phosphatidylglycerol hydrolase [Dyella sp. A6]|uniref:AcvB/VirJ family lysyl-phosphatidylglycerol hydrolase n=1 Tax=Dyella aluminiiresistens TaxID=3069105 RepID=UPI002E793AD1|nr:AcvB/VirJ family lysyl-phosphatidylglycerol hydrolase [Dyella sp. A6]
MKFVALGAVAACVVVAAAIIWNPFARPSLEKSTRKLLAAPHVQAPAGDGDVLTIIYSGDGGWADLDQQIGKLIVAHGMPVLGVSTLRYYWHMRSPEESARELDAMIPRYLAKWHKRRVWLIGFSFGADVVPSIVSRLSPANRARISQVVLLSPSNNVNFEIALEGYMRENWFKTKLKALMEKINPIPHYPSLPRVAALDGKPPVVCYYGTDDSEDGDDSLCSEPGLPSWIKVHAMPGGHHLGYDYPALVTRMLSELPRDTAPTIHTAPATSPASAASTAS